MVVALVLGSSHSTTARAAAVLLAAVLVAAGLLAWLFRRERRARGAAAEDLVRERSRNDARARSEALLRHTLERTDTGTWHWDARADEIHWSENLGPIHGLPRGAKPAGYASYLDTVHPDDRAQLEHVVTHALEEASGYEIEFRTNPAVGEVRWIWASASVLRDADGLVGGLVGLTRDVTGRRRREQRDALLARAAVVFAESSSYERAFAQLVQHVVLDLADWCSIDVRHGTELELVAMAHAGLKADVDDVVSAVRCVDASDAPDARGRIETVTADDPAVAPLMGAGLSTVIVAPLGVGRRILGALRLATGPSRTYDDEDLLLCEELARRAALALENAELSDAAASAREEADVAARHSERLQAVTAGLAAAATTSEIADVIVEQGIPALNATTGILGLLDSSNELRFVRSIGYGEVFPQALPLDAPWPITTAVRESRLIELRDLPDRRSLYDVPESVWQASGKGTLLAVPLLVRGKAIGALGFTRDEVAPLTGRERMFVEALARQAAQALERAQLFEREREARMRAELLEHHAVRVAASATAQDVAEATLAELDAVGIAAACVSVLRGPAVESLAAVGMTPDDATADQPDIGALATADAIRSGAPVELSTVDEIDLRYPGARAAGAPAVESLMAVPLRGVDGRMIGALTVMSAVRGWITNETQQLLVSVAQQSGLALDRVSLFEADRRARLRAEALQRVTGAIAVASTLDDVAQAVTSEALDVLDVSGVTVVLTTEPSAQGASVLASRGQVALYADEEPSVDLRSGTFTAAAILSGRALFAESPAEIAAASPVSAAVAQSLGVEAIACIPIRVGERKGAVGVVAPAPKQFSPEERTFLDVLARTCEQGLIRASLFEAEQQARMRAQLLESLSSALSGAVEPVDVGRGFVTHALDYIGAGSGALILPEPSGDLYAVGVGGSGSSRDQWHDTVSVDSDFIGAAAFRLGKPVAARTRAELEARFPATARTFDTAEAAYAQPLVVGDETIGAFSVVFETAREVTRDDEALLAAMGGLCAQALERARLYEREHETALRLQRALLPDGVVRHPAIQIAARYEASGSTIEVGGDWYDTFAFPDGRIGLAVGDVVGHGIEAAAAMGRLRSAFAAFASDAHTPGVLLSRLDRFVAGHGTIDFATACYAVYDPATRRMDYASAGHPPILVLEPEGGAFWLEDGRSPPIRGEQDGVRAEASVVLQPGSVVLLYSDGLVERRGELITHGLARLERVAAVLWDAPVEQLCDRLLAALRVDSEQLDDVVLLCIRTLPVATSRFQHVFPARPEELRNVRAAVRGWLRSRGVPEAEQQGLVLALGEACTNAIEHAYGGAESGEVEVEIVAEADELVVSVRDFGRWRTPIDRANRGMGGTIMETLADALNVDRRDDGTTVTMRFSERAATRA